MGERDPGAPFLSSADRQWRKHLADQLSTEDFCSAQQLRQLSQEQGKHQRPRISSPPAIQASRHLRPQSAPRPKARYSPCLSHARARVQPHTRCNVDGAADAGPMHGTDPERQERCKPAEGAARVNEWVLGTNRADMRKTAKAGWRRAPGLF